MASRFFCFNSPCTGSSSENPNPGYHHNDDDADDGDDWNCFCPRKKQELETFPDDQDDSVDYKVHKRVLVYTDSVSVAAYTEVLQRVKLRSAEAKLEVCAVSNATDVETVLDNMDVDMVALGDEVYKNPCKPLRNLLRDVDKSRLVLILRKGSNLVKKCDQIGLSYVTVPLEVRDLEKIVDNALGEEVMEELAQLVEVSYGGENSKSAEL